MHTPHYQRSIAALTNKDALAHGFDVLGVNLGITEAPTSESFTDFAQALLLRLPGVFAGVNDQDRSNTARSLYHVALLVRNGCRVFRLSAPLAVRLAHTRLSKVPCSLLKLPFATCFIEFPQEPTLVTLVDASDAHTYHCDGAYCIRHADRLDLMLAGLNPAYPSEDQVTYLTLHLEDDVPITEAMDRAFDALVPVEFGQAGYAARDTACATFTRAATLLFNALLYISSPNADLGSPQKGPATRDLAAHPKRNAEWQARQRRLACREPIVIDVGKRVRHDPELEAAARETVEGRSLSVRFVVRGHWTHQVCGVGQIGRAHV